MKLLTIIGARPQIIKAAAISRAVRGLFADRLAAGAKQAPKKPQAVK